MSSSSSAAKKRSAPEPKSRSASASKSKAKEKEESSSESSSSSSSSSESEEQQQQQPLKASVPSLLYTWKEVKEDEDLTRRLQGIYGLDAATAKVNGQPPSAMPWVIRDLLGDHMCPSSDSERDIFSTAPSDDSKPDLAKVSGIIRDLAQHIRDTHGKSGKHAAHVSAWVTSIKADLVGAYVDICKRYSQERGVANGVLTSKRVQEEQQKKAKAAAAVKKTVEPEPTKETADKKDDDKEEDSSESEQEKKEEPAKKQRTEQTTSGHDQTPPASAVSLPLPAALPPAAHAPPPTINVYKPPVKTETTAASDELPLAPPPEMLFEHAADVVVVSKEEHLDELPPAPPLDDLIASDASMEPPKNRFRVRASSNSLWDGNGLIESYSAGHHPVPPSNMYSNGVSGHADAEEEAPGFIGGFPADEFNALASVQDHNVPLVLDERLPARTPLVSVVTHKKRAPVAADLEDGQSEFDRLMRGMGVAKELSATGDS